MKLTMPGTRGDKIKVSAFRNYHFNWRDKMCVENCNIEWAKYSKKGAKCYVSSEKREIASRRAFHRRLDEGCSGWIEF